MFIFEKKMIVRNNRQVKLQLCNLRLKCCSILKTHPPSKYGSTNVVFYLHLRKITIIFPQKRIHHELKSVFIHEY